MHSHLYKLNPCNLPGEARIERKPPRPLESRQENYEELFDYKMLFADVFVDEGKLVAVGAPPLNLEPLLTSATYTLNGNSIKAPEIEHRSLCSVYHFNVPAGLGDNLKISGFGTDISGKVEASQSSFFNGCDVILALQKDNDLEWIAYWALHHSLVSGINAILLYDNGSENYTCEHLMEVLSCVPGIDRIAICSSNCPFGPTGGPDGIWDSSFGQLVHYEHARRFWLRKSRTVLVNDIDEIIGVGGDFTVVERALTSDRSAVGIPRLNVLNLLRDGFTEQDIRAHNVYGYVRKARPKLHGKYIAKTGELTEDSQFNVHLIRNAQFEKIPESDMICGNFVGVSKTWRTGKFSNRKNMRSRGNIEVALEPQLIRSMDSIASEWEKLLKVLQDKQLIKQS